ncbi:MAG: CZB domain-containing protein [Oceanospirillaceae bacterium]|nr:CZB domain-containing protein [Oceanospirillaceae bacterium]
MSFGKWLKRVFTAKQGGEVSSALDESISAGPVAAADSVEEEAAGLNFRSAIEAHQEWKVKLQSALDNDSANELSVANLCRDDLCMLGKWIHGSGGQQFGEVELFQKLRQDHARFHQCAGSVLEMVQSGEGVKKEAAQKELSSGAYVAASQDVILDLAQLYQTVSAK